MLRPDKEAMIRARESHHPDLDVAVFLLLVVAVVVIMFRGVPGHVFRFDLVVSGSVVYLRRESPGIRPVKNI